jgi:hypothetical protein
MEMAFALNKNTTGGLVQKDLDTKFKNFNN